MVLHRWESITRLSGIINCIDNVIWPPFGVCKLTFRVLALRQSNWRNNGLCVGATLFVGIRRRENKNKSVE